MTDTQASEYLARFQQLVLGTTRQERSNSARNSLYRILFDVVARHRDEIPSGRKVLEAMRESSGFDRSEKNFCHTVSLALVSMNQSANRTEIAAALLRSCEEFRDGLILERATEVLERQRQRAKTIHAAGEFLAEASRQVRIERLDRASRL